MSAAEEEDLHRSHRPVGLKATRIDDDGPFVVEVALRARRTLRMASLNAFVTPLQT
jgi:hypothetical protein